MAKILITGGAGYIGSHTALELLKEGYEVVVYDNLCNSSQESMKRVEELTGKTITFYEGDILDAEALKAMFEKEQVDAVIDHSRILVRRAFFITAYLLSLFWIRLFTITCYPDILWNRCKTGFTNKSQPASYLKLGQMSFFF